MTEWTLAFAGGPADGLMMEAEYALPYVVVVDPTPQAAWVGMAAHLIPDYIQIKYHLIHRDFETKTADYMVDA